MVLLRFGTCSNFGFSVGKASPCSSPATVKYDNRPPADEDLDEIKEWPAVSDEDVDEPIVQRVVEEVANREDGRQANIESPITKLDFTMSAPVGPSVEIPANMPPMFTTIHSTTSTLHSCCHDTTSNSTYITRSPSGPAGKITRGAGRT